MSPLFLPGRGRRRPQTGFTLLELLVTVAIIGLLIAVLLPSLKQARYAAIRAQCASRMHQTHVGLTSYQADWHTVPFNRKGGKGSSGKRLGNWSETYRAFIRKYLGGDPPQAVGYACPSLPTRGSARRSGYLYLGNYTINRPALPHYTEVLPRTLSLLRRSAEVAKRIADPRRHLDGRWLLMTDRIQIDDGTLEYDFEEDATAHDTGAVSHQRGERVAGANLLWAEGSVHWRPMPGKYQHQPLANTPSITGTEDGWARYGPPGPYIDIMCPIETLDIWYSDRGTDGWVRIAPRNAVAFSSPEIALER